MIFIDTKVPDFFRDLYYYKDKVEFSPFLKDWMSDYVIANIGLTKNAKVEHEKIREYLTTTILSSFNKAQRLSLLIPASTAYYVFNNKIFDYHENSQPVDAYNHSQRECGFISHPSTPNTYLDLLDGHFYQSNWIAKESKIPFDGLNYILQTHGIGDFISALSKSSIVETYLEEIRLSEANAELQLYDEWITHNKKLLIETNEKRIGNTK